MFNQGDVVLVDVEGAEPILAVVWQEAVGRHPDTGETGPVLFLRMAKGGEGNPPLMGVFKYEGHVHSVKEGCPWCFGPLEYGDEADEERFCEECAKASHQDLYRMNPLRLHQHMVKFPEWFREKTVKL